MSEQARENHDELGMDEANHENLVGDDFAATGETSQPDSSNDLVATGGRTPTTIHAHVAIHENLRSQELLDVMQYVKEQLNGKLTSKIHLNHERPGVHAYLEFTVLFPTDRPLGGRRL